MLFVGVGRMGVAMTGCISLYLFLVSYQKEVQSFLSGLLFPSELSKSPQALREVVEYSLPKVKAVGAAAAQPPCAVPPSCWPAAQLLLL